MDSWLCKLKMLIGPSFMLLQDDYSNAWLVWALGCFFLGFFSVGFLPVSGCFFFPFWVLAACT